jgi:hypothetical protein
MTYN